MVDPLQLSRRERQIMELIYARGESSATEVLAGLADPPTRTSVRTFLRILEQKGHLSHRKVGKEFVYKPTRPHHHVARPALRRVLSTFFGGSMEKAVAAHLTEPGTRLSKESRQRLLELINQAKSK